MNNNNKGKQRMKTKYKWRFGSRIKGNAQTAGEEIELLRQKVGGVLSADDILFHAEHESSPLHRFFEWDDSKAAHEFRRVQASDLIRAVVTIIDDGGDKREIRAFVSIRENTGASQFVDVRTALCDPNMRKTVLKNALRELQAFEHKYKDLEELGMVFSAIKKTVKKVKKK